MRQLMTLRRLCVAFILLLVSVQPAFGTSIIIHSDQAVSELTLTTVRAKFAMRIPVWPDGTPVRVFVLDDNDRLHIEFCKTILGMFPYQLRRIWDRQVFSGTGIAPVLVSSEQEMLARVAATKGAIGYLSDNLVDDSVRTVRISL